MAWGRKKSGGRKEPLFGLPAALADLRLSPEDRIPAADDDDKPKKSVPKRKPKSDDDEPPPRERKPRAARSGAKRRAKSRGRFRLGRLFYWGAVLGLWAAIAVVGVVVWVGAHLPAIQSLEIPKRPPTIQIVGLDGSVLATRGEMAGTNVALKDLPPYLPKAFIAIEDRRFYSHYGVDPIGIARAAVANVLHRGVSQGGSTLTQQLAKNLFLTQERTLAAQVAGSRARALAGAQVFQERDSRTLSQPRLFRLRRLWRRGGGAALFRQVGQERHGRGGRDARGPRQVAVAAGAEPQSGRRRKRAHRSCSRRWRTPNSSPTPRRKASIGHPSYNVKPAGAGTVNYVADWIGEVLDDLVGQIDQNIVVETTIDPKLQSVAEAAIIDELAAKSVKFNVTQGALVAMTPDGAVRAMVGGRNYAESQYNRAVTAKRQPGSAFKPFVYLTAIETGLTPETIRQDAPLDVKGWKPENYTHEYFGPVTLTQALAMSLNTVAVRLGLEVGPKNVVRTAHRLGISSKLDANASIALGTSEVSLLELVGAYAPFANGGLGVSPHVVTQDPHRSKARCSMSGSADQLGQVIEPRHVAMMNTMMQETLISGTARKAEIPGWMAAGKTGTSQDFRDAWFIGYTANLVTGVWLGNDDNSPTKKATGGGLPVEVWTRFMRAAHQGVPVASLPNSQRGGFLSNLMQTASQVSARKPRRRKPPSRSRRPRQAAAIVRHRREHRRRPPVLSRPG